MSLTRTNWSRSNTAGKFDTDEVNTHQSWIDGKPIYRKVIDVGAFPNSSIKEVSHNIRGIDQVIKIHGLAKNSTYKHVFQQGDCNIYVTGAFIWIDAASNYSTYEGYVILEYTKNE
jgi:hypothetical protein